MAEHDIHDRRLEEILDAMLSDYSGEQPRPGLETRVLATLRAEAGRKKDLVMLWRWLLGFGGIVAAMAVLLAVDFWQAAQAPSGIAVAKAPVAVQKIISPVTGETQPAKKARPRRQQVPVTTADVRLDVFPTPSPLSEQEKLLLRYLAGTPHEEVASQSHGDDSTPEDGGQLLPQSREFKSTEVFSTR